jgi:uncharacterized membrane protein YbhN (UPF0104 family)
LRSRASPPQYAMISPPDPLSARGGAQLTGIAISAITLGAVIWWASRQPAPRLPTDAAEIGAIGGALAAYGVAMALRGERWWRLLVYGGAQPTRRDAYGLTLVGYMGNNVLPARGGDAMRVYLAAPRARTGYRDVIGTLVAERLLDAVVLLSMFLLLAYGVLRGIDVPEGDRALLVAGVAASVAAGTAIATYAARDHPRVRSLIGFAAPMARATIRLRSRHGVAMVGLTLVIWIFEAATYLGAGAAAGLGMNPVEALYVVALASVFVLIPSGPGYLGTLDAAILFGAEAIGATGSQAVSFLLLVRFVLLVPVTVAGLALLLARYGGLRTAGRDLEVGRA